MKPNPLPFVAEKWHGVLAPSALFTSRTIIVTGSNVGLDFEAAVQFTSLGAEKVILPVRNEAKGEAAKQHIEARTRCRDVVEVWQLDMDSFMSITSFANQVHHELPRFDVVVLNAGASPKDLLYLPFDF